MQDIVNDLLLVFMQSIVPTNPFFLSFFHFHKVSSFSCNTENKCHFEMSIHTFEVPTVSEERWSQLRKKLAEAIYPNELEKDVGWRYGTPSWAIKPVIKAWLDEYDWEVARAEMNRWHHYQTTIEDIAIHFIHEPSKNANAVPLLLLNGWPSTFYEYHKVIEALRDGVTKEGQVSLPQQSAFLVDTMSIGFPRGDTKPSRLWIF